MAVRRVDDVHVSPLQRARRRGERDLRDSPPMQMAAALLVVVVVVVAACRDGLKSCDERRAECEGEGKLHDDGTSRLASARRSAPRIGVLISIPQHQTSIIAQYGMTFS